MINAAFEIKIALVGFVSVRKTTILNALFRDKYGEVSMRRTTAGVNHFRIVPPMESESTVCLASQGGGNGLNEGEANNKSTPVVWSLIAFSSPRSPDSILSEITRDNAVLRDQSDTEVQERFFDVTLAEPLCEMRSNTKLVVIDIPGINEAGAGSKYRGYVKAKWCTFDCVIVVMDGRQGVNSEEHVNLLQFTWENLRKKKDVPVIVLCNKVDDHEDEEQEGLIQGTRKEVERIFGVSDRTKALDDLLHLAMTSQMTLEQFRKVDKDLIDKFGREEVGKWEWKKLKEEERYAVTHKAVSDREKYSKRLQATNFDKFLAALAFSVGGSYVQLWLIEKQLEVSRNSLCIVGLTSLLAKQIRGLIEKSCALKYPIDPLIKEFWRAHDDYKQDLFTTFEYPSTVQKFASLLDELIAYHELAHEVAWFEECEVAIQKMKGVVRRPLMELFNRMFMGWEQPEGTRSEPLRWRDLTYEDWKRLTRSVLLLSYDNKKKNG